MWTICGYSLVFSGDVGGFIGNLDLAFLNGITAGPNADFAPTFPYIMFVMFQATFAIITPALITGAFAERIRFKAWIPMMALWSLVVYCPVAHWVWGPDGWIGNLGGLDFAGGLVVHMTSGFSALTAALMLGKRKDFGKEEATYNVPLILLGTAMLWFGWFGFNAGSALGANSIAGQAFATTFIAAAASMLVWMLYDWVVGGKPTAVGAAIGAVVGLVAITPAAGFVSIGSSIVIGLIAGATCNAISRLVKAKFKFDDTLDVFACHGCGGAIGAILTGVFATTTVNPDGANGLIAGETEMFVANLIGGVAVIAYSMVSTFVIIKLVGVVTNIRVTADEEEYGLDRSQHGEKVLSI